MFDQLEIPHKFFQVWIVLRMLGIRDCVPLNTFAEVYDCPGNSIYNFDRQIEI